MTAVLEVTNLVKTFGGLTATNDLSFALEPGRICWVDRAKWRRQDHSI